MFAKSVLLVSLLARVQAGEACLDDVCDVTSALQERSATRKRVIDEAHVSEGKDPSWDEIGNLDDAIKRKSAQSVARLESKAAKLKAKFGQLDLDWNAAKAKVVQAIEAAATKDDEFAAAMGTLQLQAAGFEKKLTGAEMEYSESVDALVSKLQDEWSDMGLSTAEQQEKVKRKLQVAHARATELHVDVKARLKGLLDDVSNLGAKWQNHYDDTIQPAAEQAYNDLSTKLAAWKAAKTGAVADAKEVAVEAAAKVYATAEAAKLKAEKAMSSLAVQAQEFKVDMRKKVALVTLTALQYQNKVAAIAEDKIAASALKIKQWKQVASTEIARSAVEFEALRVSLVADFEEKKGQVDERVKQLEARLKVDIGKLQSKFVELQDYQQVLEVRVTSATGAAKNALKERYAGIKASVEQVEEELSDNVLQLQELIIVKLEQTERTLEVAAAEAKSKYDQVRRGAAKSVRETAATFKQQYNGAKQIVKDFDEQVDTARKQAENIQKEVKDILKKGSSKAKKSLIDAVSQVTNLFDWVEGDCIQWGMRFDGDVIGEVSRTLTAQRCQKKCAGEAACVYFSYKLDGRCKLYDATATVASFGFSSRGGPRVCP